LTTLSGRGVVGAVLAAGSLALLVLAPPALARSRTPRTWTFAAPPELRSAKAHDALPDLYADGQACSTGCRASGAVPGWPVRPFHASHLLRAGLNELRPANFHIGVDILAHDGTPVYAVQGGQARVLASSGPDARVRVGSFEYWHIHPLVGDGQSVRPYADVVGTVLRGAGHVHLSELSGDRYINPLRPGGRVLSPWRDTARPVLARPRFLRGGRVLIRGFDPVVARGRRASRTPVLGLAGLAYRLYDERGRRGPLQWAYRGTQHLSAGLRRSVYAGGSHPAAAECAALPHPCRPNWVYRLAGGLAPRLNVRPRHAYRLVAYAFDWVGHRSALDTRVVFVRGRAYIAPPGRGFAGRRPG
jgi:hypothetical protein